MFKESTIKRRLDQNLEPANTFCYKNLLWRACLNLLPTKVNLCKKRILTDDTYPLCLREPETTEHILWECIAANDILGQSLKHIQKSKTSCQSLKMLLTEMFRKLEKKEMEELNLILWNIWRRRNQHVFNNILIGPKTILNRVQQMKHDLEGLQSATRANFQSLTGRTAN